MKRVQLLFFLSATLFSFGVWGNPLENTYPVSEIRVAYDQTHPKHLPLAKLEKLEVRLFRSEDIYYGSDPGTNTPPVYLTIGRINRNGETLQLSQSAVEEIVRTVYDCFIASGMHWTVAYIPDSEINKSGEDLRSDSDLVIVVSSPLVQNTTVKIVNPDNKEINNAKLSKKIDANLPLSLPDPSSGYPGDFINSNLLN